VSSLLQPPALSQAPVQGQPSSTPFHHTPAPAPSILDMFATHAHEQQQQRSPPQLTTPPPLPHALRSPARHTLVSPVVQRVHMGVSPSKQRAQVRRMGRGGSACVCACMYVCVCGPVGVSSQVGGSWCGCARARVEVQCASVGHSPPCTSLHEASCMRCDPHATKPSQAARCTPWQGHTSFAALLAAPRAVLEACDTHGHTHKTANCQGWL